MATRVTDAARRERRPRFVRLAASPLARACTHFTKSEEKRETARSLPERRRHGFPWVHPSNAAFSTRFPMAKKGLENTQELETHEKRERGIMGTSVERERGVMGNHHSFRPHFP